LPYFRTKLAVMRFQISILREAIVVQRMGLPFCGNRLASG
jgi:hypothetical protein